jgi:hypothetical protein
MRMSTTKDMFLIVNATKTGYLVVGTDGVPCEISRRAIEHGLATTGILERVEPTWAVLQWRVSSSL